MKGISLVFFCAFFFFIKNLYAAELSGALPYAYKHQLGEKRWDHYSGANAPELLFNLNHVVPREINFLDDLYVEFWSHDLVSDQILNLDKFWSLDLMKSGACPNDHFNQSGLYIHYTFRLMALSFYLEALKIFEQKGEFSKKSGSCQFFHHQSLPPEKHFLKQYAPKSEDMKRYLKRLQASLTFEDPNRPSGLVSFDFAQALLKAMNASSVEEGCQKLKIEIGKIFNEEDLYYGLRFIPRAAELIKSSNAINSINQNGLASACIDRFVDLYRDHEKIPEFFERVFSLVDQKIQDEKNPYAQGRFFLPGALKEFDNLGLENLLFVQKLSLVKVKKRSPVVAPIKISPSVALQPQAPVAIEPAQALPAESPKTWIPKSQLLLAQEKYCKKLAQPQREDDIKKISVDEEVNLALLGEDYVFSPQEQVAMGSIIAQYETRKALAQMKKLDHMGSQQRPIIAKFLKYMIDFERFQGLFNLTSVIGESFYLKNDLDLEFCIQFSNLEFHQAEYEEDRLDRRQDKKNFDFSKDCLISSYAPTRVRFWFDEQEHRWRLTLVQI